MSFILILNLLSISAPFLTECVIIVVCIFYLCICCFAKHNWWWFGIDFYLRERIFQMFLILFFVESIFLFCFGSVNSGLTFFSGFLINDYFSCFVKLLVLFSSLFAFYWCKHFITINSVKYTYITEFPFLFLGGTLFLLLISSTNDLLITVLCILGMSICLYSLLIANSVFGKIYREASIKYFIMSALSSGLVLGGLKEIYLWSGTLKFNLVNNYILLRFCENISSSEFTPLKIGFILILFGFMFKISAAPSHFWAPEVYEGTPYAIIIFILLPVKIAIGSVLLRLVKAVFNIFGYGYSFTQIVWLEFDFILTFIIFLSLIIGAVNSIFEYKLKRFLAYSSINQIGFLLISFLNSASLFSVQAFFHFLITYLFNMVVLFAVLLSVLKVYKIFSSQTVTTSKNLITINYIADLRKIQAFDQILSWPSALLCLSLFSLAGIPPLAGFFGKFYVLLYAFYINNWFILIMGIFTSILGAYYYLRLIKVLIFEEKIININYSTSNIFKTFNFEPNKHVAGWVFCFIIALGFIGWDIFILEITYNVAQSLYFLNY